MRFSLSTTLVLACALALGVVGCGDDDKPAAGSGGSGGAGTGGGGTGGGGTGGTGGTVDMTCGAVTCEDFPETPGGGMMLPIPIDLSPTHCCTATNACGVKNSTLLNASACLERDVVGVDTDACPAEALGTGAFAQMFTGCCRVDGKCGLNVSLLGMGIGVGCAERAELAAGLAGSTAAGFLGGDPTWTSIDCTYVPNDMDAGTGDDAGN